jgi:hypothetical protein
MVFALLRFAAVIWIFGFIVLALVALSGYLYSTEPDRTRRLQTRVRMSLMWPIALLSPAGRARLRRG